MKRPYKSYKKTDEETELNKAIGKKVKEARKNYVIDVKDIGIATDGIWRGTYKQIKQPLTQTKLAKQINVTFQQIQKYEKGANGLSSTKLLKISKFFNKPLEYFTGDATELLEKVRPTDNSSVRVSESFKNV